MRSDSSRLSRRRACAPPRRRLLDDVRDRVAAHRRTRQPTGRACRRAACTGSTVLITWSTKPYASASSAVNQRSRSESSRDGLAVLPRVLGDQAEHRVAGVPQVVGLELDVDGRAADARRALVQEHPGVRQRVPLARGARGEQELARRSRPCRAPRCCTSLGMSRMTSWIASIAGTEPPGELIQRLMSVRGSSADSSSSWVHQPVAVALVRAPRPRTTIRWCIRSSDELVLDAFGGGVGGHGPSVTAAAPPPQGVLLAADPLAADRGILALVSRTGPTCRRTSGARGPRSSCRPPGAARG